MYGNDPYSIARGMQEHTCPPTVIDTEVLEGHEHILIDRDEYMVLKGLEKLVAKKEIAKP